MATSSTNFSSTSSTSTSSVTSAAAAASTAQKDKTLREKFKTFFSIKPPPNAQTSGTGGSGPHTLQRQLSLTSAASSASFLLTEELDSCLHPTTSPLPTRLKAIKDLTDLVRTKKQVEAHMVERVFILTNDLCKQKESKEARHATYELISVMYECVGQQQQEGAMRAKLFTLIRGSGGQDLTGEEDLLPRFQLLLSITSKGKDTSYFEERIGPLLHDWMQKKYVEKLPVQQYMEFLQNFVKFNSTYMDEDIFFEVVQNVCLVTCTTCGSKDELGHCLGVLDVALCYGKLPPGCLPSFLATLCRTVNIESLSVTSWKIMKNLLGTHLGRSAIYTMCNTFMEIEDVSLVRGAVFFIGCSLWGPKAVRGLKYGSNAVLFSFEKAVQTHYQQPLISLEVIPHVQDLIKSNCADIQMTTWDLIFQIIQLILSTNPQEQLLASLNETVDSIEAIVGTRSFCGQVDSFYNLVDSCYLTRPVRSVENLMQYKLKTKLNTAKSDWFSNLTQFLEKHVGPVEQRPLLKVTALKLIRPIFLANRELYEDHLTDLVLKYLKNLENEPSIEVRVEGVEFITEFLMDIETKRGHDLLHVLEKIMNRPYESQDFKDTKSAEDVVKAVEGIISLFKFKIYQTPTSIAVSAYKSLMKHLTSHYKKPAILEQWPQIRYEIFDCFFSIRANSHYHLGYENTFSSYLVVDHRTGSSASQESFDELQPPLTPTPFSSGSSTSSAVAITGSGPSTPPPPHPSSNTPSSVTYISLSLTAACKLVVGSMKKEKDWKVLELILKSLPVVLENKALILSKNGNDVDYLAVALHSILIDKDKEFPNTLKNCHLTKAEFHAFLFPIFASLVSYHSHLDNETKQKIVKSLQQGLVTKSARMCVIALTGCTLEMKDTMHKLLPEVLLALSKIVAKVNIAIPVLEFLSTLIHLPRVFASFIQDQYMSIFAICLPYTNPFKFNHYTVSLSHHVIAMWFLKCPLAIRKQFVTFIIKGLESNFIPTLLHEDSSNRKRSASLTATDSTKSREEKLRNHDASHHLQNFHEELTETCKDFMERYTFADCSALPTRFGTTSFLMENSQTQSWLVDNKVVTIATSGCTQKNLKDGLCDKCYLVCNNQNSKKCKENKEGGGVGVRRRHCSDFTASTNNSMTKSAMGMMDGGDTVKDDLHLDLESTSTMSTSSFVEKKEMTFCTCWCMGWAEIFVRTPTGATSWAMRVQNHVGQLQMKPLRDLTALYLQNFNQDKTSTTDSLGGVICNSGDETTDSTSPHPMVQRSISSPEMNNSNLCRLLSSGAGGSREDGIVEEEEVAESSSGIGSSGGGGGSGTSTSISPTSSRVSSFDTIPEEIRVVPRDRLSTISVSNPTRNQHLRRMHSLGSADNQNRQKQQNSNFESVGRPPSGLLSPSFVFLQLYPYHVVKPIMLPSDESRSLRILDTMHPYETHKIGVVYVGQDRSETGILQNQYGSGRYREFLQGLGTLIKLREVDPQKTFLGGLDVNGDDGEFAYIWHDVVMQVIFHVATLMPNKENDPQGNFKKRHIGNDYVTIVYNNSDSDDYDITTIKAQFLHVCVIIRPLDHKTNRIIVKAVTPDLAADIGHTEAKIVSDQNLPTLARQLALHSNLASTIFQKSKKAESYASNWLERLRHIKRLKSRLRAGSDSGCSSSEQLPIGSNEGLHLINNGGTPATHPTRHLFDDFTEVV